MKYFTIEEAEALIPELEEAFTHALRLRAAAEAKASALRDLESRKGHDAARAAIERSQLQFLVNGINDRLRRIADLGALPKGLEPALVDFPFRLEGREVYLCWSRGEKRITHYHGIEEGFAGRQALPRGVRPA